MVTMVILTFLMAGAVSLYILHRHTYSITSLAINTSTEASHALQRIVYNKGLRKASQVDVTTVGRFWRLTYNSNLWYEFRPANGAITDQDGDLLCTNVTASTATLTNGGCVISVTVEDSLGGRTTATTMDSFVQFRN
jgi:hypothetical protein